MEMETKPMAAVLPSVLHDDVLAAILGRLLARGLAVSRCVCRAWRDLVDERGLLLRVQRLLPSTVTGLFVNYFNHGALHFFARPTPARAGGPGMIGGGPEFMVPGRPTSWYSITDHCNGLILYRDDWYEELCVCNPTTRRWSHLPQLPSSVVAGGGDEPWTRRAFLVFDPAASPHYDILVEPLDPAHDDDGAAIDDEWPPARWTWQVFSSADGRWRQRVFVRDGEATRTAGGLVAVINSLLLRITDARWRYGVYWRGDLYVHGGGEYVYRLSLSDGKYRIIRSPIDGDECLNGVRSFIGRSEKGVYFASIYGRHLRVWTTLHDESSDDHHQTEHSWILEHDRVLGTKEWLAVVEADGYLQIHCDGPWILDDYYESATGKRNNKAVNWSSDNDDDDDIICTTQDCTDDDYWGEVVFLGFHPYKEVVFLATQNVAVAYHMNTAKVQFLGILEPMASTGRGHPLRALPPPPKSARPPPPLCPPLPDPPHPPQVARRPPTRPLRRSHRRRDSPHPASPYRRRLRARPAAAVAISARTGRRGRRLLPPSLPQPARASVTPCAQPPPAAAISARTGRRRRCLRALPMPSPSPRAQGAAAAVSASPHLGTGRRRRRLRALPPPSQSPHAQGAAAAVSASPHLDVRLEQLVGNNNLCIRHPAAGVIHHDGTRCSRSGTLIWTTPRMCTLIRMKSTETIDHYRIQEAIRSADAAPCRSAGTYLIFLVKARGLLESRADVGFPSHGITHIDLQASVTMT
ncbi:hypothetical protein U9M48_001306 [Paspalum notatum var. saurae]|uniref:F-box domain-containing protein n=1 Tax=Paspalum notatum var. saurae TaxID=547442 RepID=A0AAQ3PI40_PASNO